MAAKISGNKNKWGNGLPDTDLKSTRWTEDAGEGKTWQEYPRPSMVRKDWMNLNGWWEYAFCPLSERNGQQFPEYADGKILVPFSPESALSSVERQLQPDEYLWYRRTVKCRKPEKGKHYLLHFGAVDQMCRVYIDGQLIGRHLGGYLPFSMEIPDHIFQSEEQMKTAGAANETDSREDAQGASSSVSFILTVCVRDISDTSYYSRGKQKLNRGGMYYTAQSGIWQTVWMEIVPDLYISSLRITPSVDDQCVRIRTCIRKFKSEGNFPQGSDRRNGDYSVADDSAPLSVQYRINDRTFTGKAGQTAVIPMKDTRLWSPDDPYLYDFTVLTSEDCVESYFAMRSFGMKNDASGFPRITLNGNICLQTGVLDQGYWCDGLYTAPSDEALIFDIQTMKDLGFNMIRKHIKIEPERWYYHCDRLGMIVWQDMVNGGTSYKDWFVTYLATVLNIRHISVPDGPGFRWLFSRNSSEGRRQTWNEMRKTMELLYNHPCIAVWGPFNEGWGQFDARKTAERIKLLDPGRLVDHASGWFDRRGGDFVSIHHYYFRQHYRAEKRRILALTEFGGYTWQVQDHSFCRKLYGYGAYQSREELSEAYGKLSEEKVISSIEKGMSAWVYTQLSDVEEEANGILTYDREILKMDADLVRNYNERIHKRSQELEDGI